MTKKQLVLLFLGSLVPWTIGNGLMCLLPILALDLGATKAMSGYYLAISFLALAGGSAFAGWLADRLQRRKQLLVVSGAILIPAMLLMGEAANVWQLAGATAAAWFSAGMAISVITILAGLFSGKNERGKVLGLIAMTNGLGSIVGGLSVGPIVDRWGYPTMFLTLCLFSITLFIIAMFVKDKKVERAANRTVGQKTENAKFGKAFYILVMAQLIAVIINSMATMGRSLSMKNLEFTATAITSTVVIAGVISLPFPYVIGWLSDRLGRKRMMVICYLGYALCIVTLPLATSLWHFWIVVILLKVGMVSINVGAAFVTDLVEPKALGRGVAVFQAMGWIAFAIGFMVAGNVFQDFGIAVSSFFSVVLPVIAIILIMSIRVARAEKKQPLAEEVPAA